MKFPVREDTGYLKFLPRDREYTGNFISSSEELLPAKYPQLPAFSIGQN